MKTILYTHPSFARHEVPPGHVEHPGRYLAVEKALQGDAFADLDRRVAPLIAAEDIDRLPIAT